MASAKNAGKLSALSSLPQFGHLDLLIPIVAAMVEISVSLSLHYGSALAG